MDETLKKKLRNDPTGLKTYEYIANNIGTIDDIMPELVENMIEVDRNGQFVVSTARYLNAIDSEKYAPSIDLLIKAAIVKDRERAYLPDLAASIWEPIIKNMHNNSVKPTTISVGFTNVFIQ